MLKNVGFVIFFLLSVLFIQLVRLLSADYYNVVYDCCIFLLIYAGRGEKH